VPLSASTQSFKVLTARSRYPENVNYVRPGQIPLLNNSPVIVLKNGRLKLAMGTPGIERATTIVPLITILQ
jgi:gamma-glutamyltranspeptidase